MPGSGVSPADPPGFQAQLSTHCVSRVSDFSSLGLNLLICKWESSLQSPQVVKLIRIDNARNTIGRYLIDKKHYCGSSFLRKPWAAFKLLQS